MFGTIKYKFITKYIDINRIEFVLLLSITFFLIILGVNSNIILHTLVLY